MALNAPTIPDFKSSFTFIKDPNFVPFLNFSNLKIFYLYLTIFYKFYNRLQLQWYLYFIYIYDLPHFQSILKNM